MILSLIYFLRSRHALFKKTYKISFTPGHFLAEIHLNLYTQKIRIILHSPATTIYSNGTDMRHHFFSQFLAPPLLLTSFMDAP